MREGLLMLPCVVIGIVHGICSGPTLNGGKKGGNQGKVREESGNYEGK